MFLVPLECWSACGQLLFVGFTSFNPWLLPASGTEDRNLFLSTGVLCPAGAGQAGLPKILFLLCCDADEPQVSAAGAQYVQLAGLQVVQQDPGWRAPVVGRVGG